MHLPIVRLSLILFAAVLLSAALSLSAHAYNKPLPEGTVADRVLIEKKARRLKLFRDGTVIKTYRVALGENPEGKKRQEGDKRTPEGTYVIDRREEQSRYHLALHISYPNPDDVAQAEERGVSPGGNIMIHGLPNGLGFIGKEHTKNDWTLGCIAVTNPEIEEIWRVVPDGTVIEIVQ